MIVISYYSPLIICFINEKGFLLSGSLAGSEKISPPNLDNIAVVSFVPGFNFLNLIKSFKDCGSRIAFLIILSAVLLYILLAAVNNLPATVN